MGRPTDCFAVAPLTVLRHGGDRHSGDAAAWSVPLRAPWALPTTERMDPTCHDFKLHQKKTPPHENHLTKTHVTILSSRMALGRSADGMRTRRAGARACRQQLEEAQQQERKRLRSRTRVNFKTKLQSPQRGKVQDNGDRQASCNESSALQQISRVVWRLSR